VGKTGGELTLREGRSLAAREGQGHGGGSRPTFIADEKGVVVPTSRSRLEEGLRAAGFEAEATRSPGVSYTLPDGSKVRVMEATPYAPTRASFATRDGSPVSPFTGRPVHPPAGMSKQDQATYRRSRTHVNLEP
jgi:hypothetical protein